MKQTIIVWTRTQEVEGRIKACNRSYRYSLPEKEAVAKFMRDNSSAQTTDLLTVLSYGG